MTRRGRWSRRSARDTFEIPAVGLKLNAEAQRTQRVAEGKGEWIMPYEDEDLGYEELDPAVNELTHAIIGAAMEVHSELGPGLDEESYEAAMCIELRNRRIPFERQVWIDVIYKGEVIGRKRLDLIIAGTVI